MRCKTVIELVEGACNTQSGKLQDALQRLFAEPDEEAVHDVRVACRRIRVVLDKTEKLFRKRLIRAVQKRVKSLLKSLGDIRDAEVFSQRAHKAIGHSSSAKMEELARLFDAETQLRRIRCVAEVDREGFATLPRLVLAMALPPAWEKKKIKQFEQFSASEYAAELLSDQLKRMQKLEKLNAGSKPGKLHSLRIEFKKLRYTAEFVEPACLAGQIRPVTKLAKEMQEVLGQLQDTAVAEEKLQPWLRKLALDKDSFDRALRELVETTQTEQRQLREAFAEKWASKPLAALRKDIANLDATNT